MKLVENRAGIVYDTSGQSARGEIIGNGLKPDRMISSSNNKAVNTTETHSIMRIIRSPGKITILVSGSK